MTEEYKAELAEIVEKEAYRKDRRQYLEGKVTSAKNKKTITVQVLRDKYVPKYQRFMRVQKKYMAHDEEELCKEGDYVRIAPCRPMSARKRHKLTDLLRIANE